MKNTNRCSKCGASDVVRIPGIQDAGFGIKTGRTIFSCVKVYRYVCCQCGFIEHWVEWKEDLQKIKLKYKGAKP